MDFVWGKKGGAERRGEERRGEGERGRGLFFLAADEMANVDVCDTETAVQRVSLRLQRHGRAVRAHGQFEDPDEPGEQDGV